MTAHYVDRPQYDACKAKPQREVVTRISLSQQDDSTNYDNATDGICPQT